MLKEAQKAMNRKRYRQKLKKSVRRIWIIWGTILFLLFFGKNIWGLIGVYIPYGVGERIGTIVKVSEKGLLWKTTEIDMVVRSETISYGDFWKFSIDQNDPNKDKLVQELSRAFENQDLVRVKYEQKAGSVPWRGKTSYFVKKIVFVYE